MLNNQIFAQTVEMVAQWGSGNWGSGGFGTGMWGGSGFMWFMPLFWLLILGLLIWFVVSLLKGNRNDGARGTENKSPLDILNERYARGEIDKEEFEERRKILK